MTWRDQIEICIVLIRTGAFVSFPTSSNNFTYSSVGTALYTLVLSPFRGQAGAPAVKDHVKLAAVRTFLEYLTIPQSQ